MDDNDAKHKQTKSQRFKMRSSHDGQMVMHARNTIDKLQINYVNYVFVHSRFDQYADF